MSTTFYGRAADGEPIMLDHEDPAHLNLSCCNARAFLSFVGLDAGLGPSGEVGLPLARRAIMRARATFDRRVGSYTRQMSDTRRPGRCRVVVAGVDEAYFERRLADFERFLGEVVERGAISIYWA